MKGESRETGVHERDRVRVKGERAKVKGRTGRAQG